MKLTSLQSVYASAGPFTSVHVDVSRTDPDAGHEIELRWRSVEERLVESGASPEALAAVAAKVTESTGLGGQLTRVVVASGPQVVLDELHRADGRPDHGHHGVLPHLMPAARSRGRELPYLLVRVDHAGADILSVEGSGLAVDTLTSEGGHDVLHKVPGGGWSHSRYQSRVEDSWDRNAAKVAKDLDSVVVRHQPEVVFLVGEEHSRSAIREHATGRVSVLLDDLDHGARSSSETAGDRSLETEVQSALDDRRRAAHRDLIDTFAARAGRDEAVANGFSAVVDALREGAVETLLLVDEPSSTWRLYAGPEPLQIGRAPDDVRVFGVDDPVEDRADEVLLRALVALDAELVILDEPVEALREGIGALLRFDIRPARPGQGT